MFKITSQIIMWMSIILAVIFGCFSGLIIVNNYFASQSWSYQLCVFLLCIFITLLIIIFCTAHSYLIKENYRMTINARKGELYCLLLMLLILIIINIQSSSSIDDFIENIKKTKDIWGSAAVVSVLTVWGNYFLKPELLMLQIWGISTYQKFNQLYLPYSTKKFTLVLHNYGSKKCRITFLGIFKKQDTKNILQKENWYNSHYPNISLIKKPSKLETLDKNCDSKPITINTQKMWEYFEKDYKSIVFYCDGILVTHLDYWSQLLQNQYVKVFKENYKELYDAYLYDYRFKTFKKFKCDGLKGKRESIDLCAVYYVENNKTGNNLVMKHFTIEKNN